MSKLVKIGIDAMSGANAPDAVLAGMADVCSKDADVFFFVFGNSEVIESALHSYPILQGRCEIVATKGVVSDHAKPVDALRSGQGTSMHTMIESLKSGDAAACVSCGNTGAMMVMAKVLLGCIENIKRPAIVGMLPTKDGLSVMLDLGVNIDCTKTHLFQFALMGDCFAKVVLHKQHPSIYILNVGSEKAKGRTLEQETAEMLREEKELNFCGYIEGHDLLTGKADVIVTDGFTGNIALKTAEGTVRLLLQLLKSSIRSSISAKIGSFFSKNAMEGALNFFNPSYYNGAMLIGLNGIVVKSHGNSNALDVSNAIGVAAELARNDINNKILSELNLSQELHPKGINKFVDKISKYLHHE
jgi:phosphate acyltransferase